MKLEEKTKRLLAGIGVEGELEGITKLHGDASYRTYYRAKLDDGRSLILMQMPEGNSSVSEEITNFNGTHRELPFINVARFLEERGLPVPKVLHYSEDDRLMILEDLGDNVMWQEIDGAGKKKTLDWYKRAVDLLVELQEKTKGATGDDCIAFARSFDPYLLDWEFRHFLEYGIEARLDAAMDEADQAVFERQTQEITREIEQLPYGFTHRDFQSRNLIVDAGRLKMIDFQDALEGPLVYDLVALLRDSYVKLSDEMVDELVKYYASRAGRDSDEVRHEFDLVTVQRKLKDAGRFVYIDRVKGNPSFLKYIPDSIGYVKDALARLPEHHALAQALSKYIPEWK